MGKNYAREVGEGVQDIFWPKTGLLLYLRKPIFP